MRQSISEQGLGGMEEDRGTPTQKSFPPTPGARSFVMARSEDLLFVARDQLVKVYVTDLESETMYCVIGTRRLKEVHRGRGDASDVLSRPHIHPDVETLGWNKGTNADRTFNTPNEKIGVASSPRMGATLVEFGGSFKSQGGGAMHDLFLFGGMTEGEKCDDAGSTDTLSLGEEDSGGAWGHRCRG
ncbi:hypothetical protein TrCOL_g12552 [Triparma columacea]|uniref:Uncharacterized protein n=1 Tax=Triparma columacea TaxID=722753 RepID=A0A9W7GKE4_9STRA|nr:hypothetical protein TrCOL_g12552 [Triparma columacea]